MEAKQPTYGARDELLSFLLERIESDRYPSSSMMDLVEELLGPEDVEDYATVLMAKVRQDEFPSLAMLHRVRALT